MRNVILANIGNRNLTYQHKTLLPDNRLSTPQPSFRERTFELLEQYDNVKVDLNEQILSFLLNNIGADNIEKIVLFASDNQILGDRKDQDTIHEARILQRLFTEQMNLTTEIVVYTQNVTHNDELLQFYRNQLRPYQSSNAEVIICDAGGTPQQKAALKIAAEFLLNPSRFTVRYVLPSGEITTVEQVEYRRIIDEEQVAALVEHGQYTAAYTVYNNLSNKNLESLIFLQIMAERADLFWDDAGKNISTALANESLVLFNLKNKISLGSFSDNSIHFTTNKMMYLTERLEIAQFRFYQQDWTRAVMGLSIFMESMINAIIQNLSPYKLEENYSSEALKLLTFLKSSPEHTDIRDHFFQLNPNKELQSGLPLHLKFAQKLTFGVSQQLINEFMLLNSWTNSSNRKRGLDQLRNDIAHKGRSVKQTDLLKQVPDIENAYQRIRQLLNFPPENTYLTLNNLLLENLRT